MNTTEATPKMKKVLLTPAQQRFVIDVRSNEPEFVRRGAVLEWGRKLGIGQNRVKAWLADGYLPSTQLPDLKESRYERDVMLRKLLAKVQKPEKNGESADDVALSKADDQEGAPGSITEPEA